MSAPRLFFTADLHFDHVNADNTKGILHYCEGRRAIWDLDIKAMNLALCERWNDTVSDDDHVIVLGDFAMGKRADSVQHGQWLRGRYKKLIPGNHDHPWNKGRDGAGTTDAKHMRHVMQYFEWGGFHHIQQPPVVCGALLPGLDKRIEDTILSHLPPAECGDHTSEMRYEQFRPDYPPDDTYMLVGHVHEAWKVHGRVINVGVDQWDYAPVSADQLLKIMQEGVTNG